MVLRVLNKVNRKLKFLYRQSEHLNPRQEWGFEKALYICQSIFDFFIQKKKNISYNGKYRNVKKRREVKKIEQNNKND